MKFQPKKSKILMAGPIPYRYGGISSVVGMILASSLPERFDVKYIATGTKGSKIARFWQAIHGITQMAWASVWYRPDLVHLHVSKGASLIRKGILTWLAGLTGTPVILHLHTSGPHALGFYDESGSRWLKRLTMKMLDRATCILVLSTSCLQRFQAITTNPNMRVLVNPIDCESIYPNRRAPGNPMRVLFMGDLSASKGAFDLVEAIPLVIANFPHVHFVLCGNDHDGIVHSKIRANGVADSVQLPGFVLGREKLHQLQQASIFVLPSYEEGVPIAILEAMAAGLPIVTTPVGGIPDILEHGENALLVEPGDVEGLACGIIDLLRNETLRTRMSLANRRKAEEEFDLSIFLDRLQEVYRQILEDAHAS